MTEPLRVLHLEDQPMDGRLVLSELRRSNFEVAYERIDNEQDFVQRVQSEWDLILADYSLPQFDALRALQLLRESGRDIPFIIVSGSIGEETAVAAMKEGATDYLLKDRLGRLVPAVRYALEQRHLRDKRRKAEEHLRQSEMRFRAISSQLQVQIQRMPLAYILLDEQNRVVDWNPAAEAIFGYAKSEVLGMLPPYEQIMPVACRDQLIAVLQRLQSGDMAAHSSFENLRKDGHVINCEWFNTPLKSDDGLYNGAMCLVLDVTERKQLEDQFRQAQKMEVVGRLAGGVAHDFNNLLTIILGYSEILQERLTAGDSLFELVEQIHHAGERASGLTRQLLAFSRKQVLVPVSLDVNALIANMKKMLVRLIGEDVQIEFRCAEPLRRVRADAGQFEQVLMNLVINSRDAMPLGGKVTVETANVDLDESYVSSHPDARVGRHVVLMVSDTGCGMDRMTLGKIFEPFFSTKGDKGTGLGLATVYGIVKQTGGHITVESQPGRGTTFRIYLPEDPQSVRTTATHGDQVQSLQKGKETVLLVEDEEAVRTFACAALDGFGYTILQAENGIDALRVCREYSGDIHLLATDLVMPDMSGRELAESIHSIRPETKILYMSGYMDDAVIRHGLNEGRVPLLQKPFTLSSLGAKVREVLDNATRT